MDALNKAGSQVTGTRASSGQPSNTTYLILDKLFAVISFVVEKWRRCWEIKKAIGQFARTRKSLLVFASAAIGTLLHDLFYFFILKFPLVI